MSDERTKTAIEKSLEVDADDASLEELEAAEEVLDRARRSSANRGTAQRSADSKAVFRATRDPRAAIRAYCRGNRWLEENAKAVGNW